MTSGELWKHERHKPHSLSHVWKFKPEYRLVILSDSSRAGKLGKDDKRTPDTSQNPNSVYSLCMLIKNKSNIFKKHSMASGTSEEEIQTAWRGAKGRGNVIHPHSVTGYRFQCAVCLPFFSHSCRGLCPFLSHRPVSFCLYFPSSYEPVSILHGRTSLMTLAVLFTASGQTDRQTTSYASCPKQFRIPSLQSSSSQSVLTSVVTRLKSTRPKATATFHVQKAGLTPAPARVLYLGHSALTPWMGESSRTHPKSSHVNMEETRDQSEASERDSLSQCLMKP